MKKKETVTVEQKDGAEPVEKKILAQAIVEMSDALIALRKSGINEKGIVALIKDYCGMPKTQIHQVLDALAELRRTYCA